MYEGPIQNENTNDDLHESPMLQKFNFNVDVVFDDLEAIIPQYNQFIESRGNQVPEEMISCQREALNTMRSIKNSDQKPKSKEELILELDRRKKENKLTDEAADLILGILES